MSIYIKVKQSNVASLVGSEILSSTKADAVKNLIEFGVIDAEHKNEHHNTTIRRLLKSKAITAESIKGSLRDDRQVFITHTDRRSELPAETRAWLNGEESNCEEAEDLPPCEMPPVEITSEDYWKVIQTQNPEPAKKVAKINPAELAQQFTNQKGDNPFGMLAEMIAPFVKPDYSFAAEQINKLVADAVKLIRPDKLEVYLNGEFKATTDKVHYRFKDVVRCMVVREHTFMVGAAGSGKTTLAHQAAESLGLPFYAMSVGQQTTKSEIFGYTDANSNYKETMFRKAYEHGGVFLFDEMDAGNAGVLTSINSALANSFCGFPDGKMVKRHDDFICIAAANTYGRGADRQYVGRQQLDAATLDRFTVVEIDYDEELELEIAGNRDWTRKVQSLRAKAFNNKVRVVISPRASIKGAKLMNAGFTEAQVMEMVIFKGISESERTALLN